MFRDHPAEISKLALDALRSLFGAIYLDQVRHEHYRKDGLWLTSGVARGVLLLRCPCSLGLLIAHNLCFPSD